MSRVKVNACGKISISVILLIAFCWTFFRLIFAPYHRTRSVYGHGGLAASSAKLKWWQTTVIYQIYPRSFQDSNGDGTGDLKGILSRLDYLEYLGIETIWISPFYLSPMRDFGYDVTDYKQVDPIFGMLSDFEELVRACHSRGIRVIIDFVPNHTSNESVWFEKSRSAKDREKYRDYYIWNPGITLKNGTKLPPNNWESNFGGSAWTYDDTRGEFYYHAFLSSQPDLNYRNKEVLQEIDAVLEFWLDKLVDGFRIDAITKLFEVEDLQLNNPARKNKNEYIPNLFKNSENQPEIFGILRRWRAILDKWEDKHSSSKLLIAETSRISDEQRKLYYEEGAVPFYFKRTSTERLLIAETSRISDEHRKLYYEEGAVPFYFNLIKAKGQCEATAKCFHEIIRDGTSLTAEDRWPNFVIGNHDNSRLADRMGIEYVDAMNLMLLTLPGTPTTYYGEELGMIGGSYRGMTPKDPFAITSGKLENSRDPERNPMQWDSSPNAGFSSSDKPWLPVTENTNWKTCNIQEQKKSIFSHLSIYRELVKIRKNSAFLNPFIYDLDSIEDILIYIRKNKEASFLVVINFGKIDSVVDTKILNYTAAKIVLSTKEHSKIEIDLKRVEIKAAEGIIVQLK